MHEHRSVLLFHVSAILNVFECVLGFLEFENQEKKIHFYVPYDAIDRSAFRLDQDLESEKSNFRVVFGLLYRQMIHILNMNGRKEPLLATKY